MMRSMTDASIPFSRATRSRKRRLESDLAVHGSGGDGGDMILDADLVGQFVDAFLVDHGRIHVGDQDFLFAAGRLLNDDVERFGCKHIAKDGFRLFTAHPVRQREVAGDVFAEP